MNTAFAEKVATGAQVIPPHAANSPDLKDRSELLVSSWLTRDIPPRDFLLYPVFTTTSRWMVYGPTGHGKTLLAGGLAGAIASNSNFLGWFARRPASVMYLDGELPAETFKERMKQLADLYGENMQLYGYSRDVLGEDAMPPLNTEAGQTWLWQEIELVRPDAIFFDSMMCLLQGDLREETTWEPCKSLVRQLSARRIAQVWLHHTGHDTSRSYGSTTKTWELDTVAAIEQPEDEPDTFRLTFKKARLRTPETAHHFRDMRLTLDGNGWHAEDAPPQKAKRQNECAMMRGFILKSLDAMTVDLPEPNHKDAAGRRVRAAKWEDVRQDMVRRGYLERDNGKVTAKDRQLLSRAKKSAFAASQITEADGMIWRLKSVT